MNRIGFQNMGLSNKKKVKPMGYYFEGEGAACLHNV